MQWCLSIEDGPLLMPKIRPSLGAVPPKWEKTCPRCGRTAVQNFVSIGKPGLRNPLPYKKSEKGTVTLSILPILCVVG